MGMKIASRYKKNPKKQTLHYALSAIGQSTVFSIKQKLFGLYVFVFPTLILLTLFIKPDVLYCARCNFDGIEKGCKPDNQ
jgi:hypothetical protein